MVEELWLLTTYVLDPCSKSKHKSLRWRGIKSSIACGHILLLTANLHCYRNDVQYVSTVSYLQNNDGSRAGVFVELDF